MNDTIHTADLAGLTNAEFHGHEFTCRITPQYSLKLTGIGATTISFNEINHWGGPVRGCSDKIANLSLLWDVTPVTTTTTTGA